MDKFLKKTISKKVYDGLMDGTITGIDIEMSPYWCNRFKGLSNVCPYSLPFNDENRFCQKYGKPCSSGKKLKYFGVELKQSKTNNILICDIETMKLKFEDDKLILKINLTNIFKNDLSD